MDQVAIPFYHDLLNFFKKQHNETLILMACYTRNVDQFGCCSNKIINKRTGLCDDTIQRGFDNLVQNNQFQVKKCWKNTRYGKILDRTFLEIYPRHLEQSKFHNCFMGRVVDINPIQKTVSIISFEDKQYIIHCLRITSPIFFLPLGTFIQFNGHVLENLNSCVNVLIQEDTLKCFSSMESELLTKIKSMS